MEIVVDYRRVTLSIILNDPEEYFSQENAYENTAFVRHVT